MRAFLAGLVLAAAVALPACQYCVDGASPHKVSGQPLGAHCARGSECAASLACIGHRCTVSCAGSPSACPAESVCVEAVRDDQGNPLQVCMPTCASEADCSLGASVGWCLLVDPAFCDVVSCQSDAGCATGARCVGVSEARGITWNRTCGDGFCQR